ncbi:MAG TPA: tetratricopeptide repeat protein [Candidatus Babeliales bacterium]|nr:tetratricopeptide repeat protein [Candidatus Babeliales bacterium]
MLNNNTSQKNSRMYQSLSTAMLALATIITYYPSLHYEFQFDDIANISRNYNIRHYHFTQLFFAKTRWIVYWLNSLFYTISGIDPYWYRVFNIALHITNGLLVFFLLYRGLSALKKQLFFKRNALSIATTTAVLFLLHPVQSQTVSYVIQGQLEGLATLCVLAASRAVMLYGNATHRLAKFCYAMLIFFLAALSSGTKEIAIVGPLLFILTDWFFIAQREWDLLKKRFWLHGCIIIMTALSYLILLKPKFFTDVATLSLLAKNSSGNVIAQTTSITPYLFCISQFKVIIHYLFIFLWPFNLNADYDWTLCTSFFDLDCILPFTLLACIGIMIVYLLNRNLSNVVLFGLIWFFICIAPRSSIIPAPELLADYKTYMASVGWLFTLTSGTIWCITKIKDYLQITTPNVALLLCFSPAIPLGLLTAQRNTVWRSGLEFWDNVLQTAPNKARAHNNYGIELLRIRQYDQAMPYFQKAIDLDTNYSDPYNNLATAYASTQQLDLAISTLEQGIAINSQQPEAYNNLASFYLQKNDLERAQSAVTMAIKLRPHYGKAHFNLGRIYMAQNDQVAAWRCFKQACLHADLTTEVGFNAYAQASFALQKYDDAIVGYKKLLQCNPDHLQARNTLHQIYALKNT